MGALQMISSLRRPLQILGFLIGIAVVAMPAAYAQEQKPLGPAATPRPTGAHPLAKGPIKQESDQHCENISANSENTPIFSITYKCVPQNLCNRNNYPPGDAANDKCKVNNTDTCKSKDCDTCHGVARNSNPKAAATYRWKEDETCRHGGEGDCTVTVRSKLTCDCHC